MQHSASFVAPCRPPANPFAHLRHALKVGDKTYHYYSLVDLKDPRVGTRP